MNESKISVRYARALFEAAQDMGILEVIHADLGHLEFLQQEVPEFKELILNPIMKQSRKKEHLTNLFKSNLNELTFKFLMLLAENKREVFLSSVWRVFNDFYKKEKGILAAKVTTAALMQEDLALRMKKQLEKYFNSIIELDTIIKPEIIGGFVLRVEDLQLDSSVASQLRKIRKGLDGSVIP